MSKLRNTNSEHAFWSKRYQEQRTGWDIGYPSTPLKVYINQLNDQSQRILIPGAGNAYEAQYLFEAGFKNVFILDIAQEPLDAFARRVPEFPTNHINKANFFEHEDSYDLIFEQTFFCSFVPSTENRKLYAQQMDRLLNPNGKLVGLWFDFPLTGDLEKRPFGGSKSEYLTYLSPYFHVKTFETCYNSIGPRQGKELFGIFQKKSF